MTKEDVKKELHDFIETVKLDDGTVDATWIKSKAVSNFDFEYVNTDPALREYYDLVAKPMIKTFYDLSILVAMGKESAFGYAMAMAICNSEEESMKLPTYLDFLAEMKKLVSNISWDETNLPKNTYSESDGFTIRDWKRSIKFEMQFEKAHSVNAEYYRYDKHDNALAAFINAFCEFDDEHEEQCIAAKVSVGIRADEEQIDKEWFEFPATDKGIAKAVEKYKEYCEFVKNYKFSE